MSAELSRRQREADADKEVCALSWRAQNRLNHRFKALSARGLHRNKVVVAVARELCGYLWELDLLLRGGSGATAARRNRPIATDKTEKKKPRNYQLK